MIRIRPTGRSTRSSPTVTLDRKAGIETTVVVSSNTDNAVVAKPASGGAPPGSGAPGTEPTTETLQINATSGG